MKNSFSIIVLVLCLSTCISPEKKPGKIMLPDIAVKSSDFETITGGKEVKLFNLTNENGMIVQITNYGACIVSILLPSIDGNYTDVALGYKNIEGYLNDRMSSGCIVGRYANRISKGSFEIDGVRYQLEINNNENTLHSGSSNYGKFVWDAYQSGDSVFMNYLSPHMDGGFPGELKVSLIYALTDDNKLEMIYTAETTAKTVVNLTNHAYFNLAGEGSGEITGHLIMINGDHITPVNQQLIPSGKFLPVENTPFDLREEVKIGKMIDHDNEQISFGNGYDHNWVLNKENPGDLSFAASYSDPESGNTLRIYTTEPGIQLYTGNFMNGTLTGKSGTAYHFRNGLALEAQHFPDSPNQPAFPSTLLKPGEKYYQKTVLEFVF